MAENACRLCGMSLEEKEYNIPLCRQCHNLLSHRPFPLWLKALSVVTLLVLGFSLSRFPATLRAAIAFEEGQMAERNGQYSIAIAKYQKALERFPTSTSILARLGISYERSGKTSEAIPILSQLSGYEGDTELVDEVNQSFDRINNEIGAYDLKIQQYKTKLNEMESALKKLYSIIKLSSDKLQSTTQRIAEIENETPNHYSLDIKQYEGLVNDYNNMVLWHNARIQEADSIYKEYQILLEITNNLIGKRNKLLSTVSK